MIDPENIPIQARTDYVKEFYLINKLEMLVF